MLLSIFGELGSGSEELVEQIWRRMVSWIGELVPPLSGGVCSGVNALKESQSIGHGSRSAYPLTARSFSDGNGAQRISSPDWRAWEMGASQRCEALLHNKKKDSFITVEGAQLFFGVSDLRRPCRNTAATTASIRSK